MFDRETSKTKVSFVMTRQRLVDRIGEVGAKKALEEYRTSPQYQINGRINLSFAHFPSADFRGAFLADVDLIGARMVGAKLHGTILQAELGGENMCVQIHGADLSNTDLFGVCLANLNLSHVMFMGSNLVKANLSNSVLVGALFQGATMQNALLQGSVLKSAESKMGSKGMVALKSLPSFVSVNLEGVDLRDTVATPELMTKLGATNIEKALYGSSSKTVDTVKLDIPVDDLEIDNDFLGIDFEDDEYPSLNDAEVDMFLDDFDQPPPSGIIRRPKSRSGVVPKYEKGAETSPGEKVGEGD
jgi:uncharacterized protein YjbI with pentapeptide repeats